ncbi:MAG TPA: hypothetical protein VLA09_11355 [Longimicrobiales bacterium]|nr:hypothetical protein [Longimicrobiales bacterium]
MRPILQGLSPCPAYLFDERRRPDFRDIFGALAAQASVIATAVTRVRLSAVDLTRPELERVEHFRVLVAEMNALHLDADARGLQADPRRAPNAELLSELLERGRLQVRSSPLAGWAPDFTVFSSPSGPQAVLVGSHWFERPFPHRGPALGAVHIGDAARLAAQRHDEAWDRAHDVGPAVWSILSNARSRALRARAPGG